MRPLSEASRYGYTEVVKLLLHGGADMDAADIRCFAYAPRESVRLKSQDPVQHSTLKSAGQRNK